MRTELWQGQRSKTNLAEHPPFIGNYANDAHLRKRDTPPARSLGPDGSWMRMRSLPCSIKKKGKGDANEARPSPVAAGALALPPSRAGEKERERDMGKRRHASTPSVFRAQRVHRATLERAFRSLPTFPVSLALFLSRPPPLSLSSSLSFFPAFSFPSLPLAPSLSFYIPPSFSSPFSPQKLNRAVM